MELIVYICVALAAYFLGSIPTGYLVARSRGMDIRTFGSGNIGATNVFRALGKRAGTLVLLIDLMKGYVAVVVVSRLMTFSLLPGAEGPTREMLAITAGICAVLGHNYTCWLGFKGGKGIATSAGVILAWVPAALLIIAGIWLFVLAVSRYVSLASIAAALFLPAAIWLTRGSPRMIIIGIILGALAVYKHRTNIERLCKGTEHRLGAKRAPSTSRSAS